MKKLTGIDFKGMIASGAANLENSEKEINTLNVFPVPDGDTGTNMSMTFNNGSKEANGTLANGVGDIAKALSKGLLMGARGNSGVITSQIFRGFAKYSEGKDELEAKEVAEAFVEGARVAYKAIMKPVEGTILTVIREAAWYADHDFIENPNIDIETYFENLVSYAKVSLDNTPNLLPALKEAGVVDSGGAGLLKILEGFSLYLKGQAVVKKEALLIDLTNEASDNEYLGYLIEFKLKLNKEYLKNFDESVAAKRLEQVGEKLSINKEKEYVNIKLYSIKPGEVLNIAQRYGEFVEMKIENKMIDKSLPAKEKKKYGLIAVAAGEGISQLFNDLGVDIVVSGGQTMNPSTKDFVDKIDELEHCEHIFIFPNNSNIILAAEQARSLTNKDVVVIPTKSIQAGLSAIALFDPEEKKETNEINLRLHIETVKTAQITYAIKDTSFDGVEVKEGDYIALVGKTILDSSRNLTDLCLKTMDKLVNENKDLEMMTIIVGEDGDEDVTNAIKEHAKTLASIELEIIKGNQPVYSYLFGLE